LAAKYNINVIATVHDALLIEADSAAIDRDVARMKQIMRRASRIVLDSEFELRVGGESIHYPNRYTDKRGEIMWRRVNEVVAEIHRRKSA
jgi:hypothetical protein